MNFRVFCVRLCVLASVIVFAGLVFAGVSQAENIDFGGRAEKFKGGGDKEPPRCQVAIPKASRTPFFIKWDCVDNWADKDDITSELWIYRKNATAGKLVTSFLGFPASVYVDEALLQVENFEEGLPVSFRLAARDRAGITTFTKTLTVGAQNTTLSSCDLQILTQATESSGNTTGQPAQSIIVENGEITSTQIDTTTTRIVTPTSMPTKTCEIESVCEDDENVMFDISFEVASDKSLTGTLIVSPGILNIEMTGTATVSNYVVTGMQATGTTTIGATEATVSLTCTD